MKYLILILFAAIFLQDIKTYKEYNGGRKGFSYSRLVLCTDHTYYYSERYDFPGTLRDEGEWSVKNNKLILVSSKRNKGNNKKLFKGKAFEIRSDEVIIQTGQGKINTHDVLKEKIE